MKSKGHTYTYGVIQNKLSSGAQLITVGQKRTKSPLQEVCRHFRSRSCQVQQLNDPLAMFVVMDFGSVMVGLRILDLRREEDEFFLLTIKVEPFAFSVSQIP